jgi:hypothetical protein
MSILVEDYRARGLFLCSMSSGPASGSVKYLRFKEREDFVLVFYVSANSV